MYVLGIETSCDETAASVVRDGREILSNVVTSSLGEHKKYGGIIPEVAFRKQIDTIDGIVDCSLKEAGLGLRDIDLIAVTCGPGLAGSLLVGISFAKALSFAGKIPLLGVNHLESHLYSALLNASRPRPPFVALVVSGGHTSLFYVRDFKRIEALGATHDDACGEAFDKVAKILGLGYPGGPAVEKAARNGDGRRIKFSCSNTEAPLDFSFSGVKTAVLYYVKRHGLKDLADIAASFQEAVVNTLVKKSLAACRHKQAKALVIGGGVAANKRLRQALIRQASLEGVKVYLPAAGLCTDNAAMVAGLAFHLFKKGRCSGLELNPQLN